MVVAQKYETWHFATNITTNFKPTTNKLAVVVQNTKSDITQPMSWPIYIYINHHHSIIHYLLSCYIGIGNVLIAYLCRSSILFLYKLGYKIVLSSLVGGINMADATITNGCITTSSSKIGHSKKNGWQKSLTLLTCAWQHSLQWPLHYQAKEDY